MGPETWVARWRARLVAALTVVLMLGMAAPGHAAKLFVTLSQPHGELPSGPILRYDVPGPSSGATLETAITDPSFDNPLGIAFAPNGDMLVTNRADQSHGSISRISNPTGVPVFNTAIDSPAISGPHFPTFRENELFVPQLGGSNVIRFLFAADGTATFNGGFTTNLCCNTPRAAAVSPSGELFVSQCCLQTIQRYLIDGAGNVTPHGEIVDPRLTNPHRMAFAPWGELFVAQDPGVWGGVGNVYRFVFDAAGNAVPNGVIETGDTLSLTFSPWGELFVGLVGGATPGVSRWTFDADHTAHPNGVFATPQAVTEVAFAPPTAPRVTVRVDDDRAQCPRAQFRRIGSALRAVPPGSTVLVCPGTYVGPVRINKAGARVVGASADGSDVVLVPDPRFGTPIVEMSAPATVLANLSLDHFGPDPSCFVVGVLVDNGARLPASVIRDVTVHQARQLTPACRELPGVRGAGIVIGGREAGAIPGRAIVHHNAITAVTSGVEVHAGSTARIRDNRITSAPSADFGHPGDGAISVLGGRAVIQRNNAGGFFGHGVFVQSGVAEVGGRRQGNNIHNSVFGVGVYAGGRATVDHNNIHHSQDGVAVFALAHGSVVANNAIHDNGRNGIHVEPTASGHQFLNNRIFRSPLHEDCFDASHGTGTAGTANTWIGNIGARSFPPGICRPPAH